jgi:hypothetical protein
MTENTRLFRQWFMAIAVAEHHQMTNPVLSTYDICDRLGPLWLEIRNEAQAKRFSLEPECIQKVNERIAKALDLDAGVFRNREGWASFIAECPGIDSDPYHVCSWIFSALYWDHLTRFKLATAWIFTNALRIQHTLPEYRLAVEKLGAFLHSLSGSGPPTYDGQTFYPDQYA